MILELLVVAVCLLRVSAQDSPPTPPVFDWSAVTPSPELNWVPCYEPPLQCTRLTAPLNYSNPEAGTIALALLRIPASSAGSPSYKGPLLFNPGGPGGPGVGFILNFGRIAAPAIGPDYDLVGFDPRGVGDTTPKANFFKNSAERGAFGVNTRMIDLDFRSDQVENHWAKMQVFGRLAQDRDSGILAHITTDNVARDMLTISNAHGQEKVNYYGISYGSLLGSTFASMFPEKVGKFIIDGIVNFDAHYNNNRSTELVDSEKSLKHFLDECHKVGKDLCPFYEESRSALDRRLDKLFVRVGKQPIPAYSPNLPAYGVINPTSFKAALLAALYAPIATYYTLAQALTELENGDGSLLYSFSADQSEKDLTIDALFAIDCTDSVPVHDTPKELRRYAESIDHLSRFQSSVGALRLLCSGWRIHPNNFRGPQGGNTSTPLLVIGNTADPVTPIANGRIAVERFPGSVLLHQDTPGHASISTPSECTLAAVNAYLNQDILPKVGTVCPYTGSYFNPPGNSSTPSFNTSLAEKIVQRRQGEHGHLVDAAEALRAAMQRNPFMLKRF